MVLSKPSSNRYIRRGEYIRRDDGLESQILSPKSGTSLEATGLASLQYSVVIGLVIDEAMLRFWIIAC